jgi:hypothetical protein
VRASDGDDAATVRYAPSGKWVERLTGLDLPIEDQGGEKGRELVEKTLAPVIGSDINRALYPAKEGEPIWYVQTHQVGGKELPVFGHGTALHVAKNGRLTAVTNDVVPPEELKVTGDAGAIDIDAAREEVCRQLGICKETLTGIHEGIYLVDDNPDRGRVVLRFAIASGGEKRDVEVYFDQKTQTIVDVR